LTASPLWCHCATTVTATSASCRERQLTGNFCLTLFWAYDLGRLTTWIESTEMTIVVYEILHSDELLKLLFNPRKR
jgi:hypothetical protein